MLSTIKYSYPNKGFLFVALSGLLYGCLGYFGSQLLVAQCSITTMLFWRFLLAGLWMLTTRFWVREKSLAYTLSTHRLLKAMLISVFFYSGGSFFYFVALQYIGTAIAMVIFFSFPVFVVLYELLFTNFRMNWQTAATLLAVIGGLVLLQDGCGVHHWQGLLYAGIASVFYASYILYSKCIINKVSSRLFTIAICFGNALFFMFLSLYQHSFSFPATAIAWCNVLAIGIIATALPIQLLLEGLKTIDPFKASVLSVLEPVTTILIGVILLDEHLSLLQSVGVIVVLLGAITVQFKTIKRVEIRIKK